MPAELILESILKFGSLIFCLPFPLLFLLLLPLILLPHYVSSLSASFSLPTGQSLEQIPQGESEFVPSWRPQVTPTVETPSPSALSPSSALVLCGPPSPSQPQISQTAIAPPSDQDAGTESKRHNDPCCACLIRISITIELLNPTNIQAHVSPCWLFLLKQLQLIPHW